MMTVPMMDDALAWIVGLLTENGVPFLVCGGFAAAAYGSKRPIQDIDLFVPDAHFARVVQSGKARISKPPRHYLEEAEGWHVTYVQFRYEDIKIEIGSAADVRIFDRSRGRWVDLHLDFTRIHHHRMRGLDIPLMAKEDLIAYKRLLGRAVDLEDIEAMQAGVAGNLR